MPVTDSLPLPQRMTPEEYLAHLRAQPRKYEYVDGWVYPLHDLAGASFSHNRLAARALSSLAQQLGERPCEPVGSDQLLHYWSDTTRRYYLPDVQVLCDDLGEDLPILIIEVVSPSTAVTDQREKLVIYTALPYLHDYVLIWSDRQRVDHYARTAEWRPVTYTSGLLDLANGLSLDMDRLYQHLRLAP
jgi:Uma2 family endonuclease